jgi:pimeloyl-ACP methyl ester carboxylesterase
MRITPLQPATRAGRRTDGLFSRGHSGVWRDLLRVKLPRLCLGLSLGGAVAGLLHAQVPDFAERLPPLGLVIERPPEPPTATFFERVEKLYRAPLAEQIALSVDGSHVAYTKQVKDELQLVILDLWQSRRPVTLQVEDARGIMFSSEKQRAQLRFLCWATNNRLVFAPTPEYLAVMGSGKYNAPVMAVDGDGRNSGVLVEASEFSFLMDDEARAKMPPSPSFMPSAENSASAGVPLGGSVIQRSERSPLSEGFSLRHVQIIPRLPEIKGFVPGSREQILLYVPALIRNQHVLAEELWISLHIHTGKRTPLGSAERAADWDDARWPFPSEERRVVQQELALKFPERTVTPVDWSQDLQHILVNVMGGNERGRIFVYQRPQNLVLEVLQLAPWLKSTELNSTQAVALAAPGETPWRALVTWPRTSRRKVPPVLVLFAPVVTSAGRPMFDPEAQVFADLGYVVVRPDLRPAPAGTNVDRAAADDAAFVLARLAAQFPDRPFDAKHVAVMGRGVGGYLAMRALQLRPEVFHAGIASDAPMDLRRWLEPENPTRRRPPSLPAQLLSADARELTELSVTSHLDALTQPVLFIVEPARSQSIEIGVGQVRSKMKSLHRSTEYLEVDPGFARALPKARATVSKQIDDFLNLHLYRYGVKIGPTQEIK